MNDANRFRLMITLLGLVGAAEKVLCAISALRDGPVDDDMLGTLTQIHALFARNERHEDADAPDTLPALEATLTQFICDLSEVMLQPAMRELNRIEPQLTSPDARAVLPLLQIMVDGLKEHGYPH